MSKKLDLLHWVLMLILFVLLALFWFTPYTYHNYAGVMVRIHRVSGKPDILDTTGWQRMEKPQMEEPQRPQRRAFKDDLGWFKEGAPTIDECFELLKKAGLDPLDKRAPAFVGECLGLSKKE